MQQSTSYDYDSQGRLWKILDAKHQTTEYGYDGQGRLETISYADGRNVTLNYDGDGNLAGYDDGVTSATYTYDALGRKLSETVNYPSTSLGTGSGFSKSFSYSYHPSGQKESFTAPDGTTYEYIYGANNELREVKIPGLGAITMAEYEWNRPTTVLYPGGGKRELEYDGLMRLKHLTATDPGGNALLEYGYEYDGQGNIVSKTTEHGTYSYGYDGASRLTSADNPTSDNESYSYDAVGNRSSASNATGSISHNANNELTAYGELEYEYDDNGNMTEVSLSGQVVFSYHYNADNRLVKVEGGNNNTLAEYYYDPFGRRLWKDVAGTRTYFFYSDEGLIAEYDASGNELKSYGYQPDSTWTTDPLFLKQGSQYYFYQNDHLGTPQKLMAQNGAVVWSATYSSFGEASVEISTVTNNLRFPGQYFDVETGLHYNFQRYYDPVTGRYVSVDPVGVLAGTNTFTYAENNPLTKFDSRGLWVELDKIVPPEEAFTAIQQAVQQRQANLENARLHFWLYDAFYKMADFQIEHFDGGRRIHQQYLESLLVSAQTVRPAMSPPRELYTNRFIFTCKYGWIDVGHFFAMALMAFTIELPEVFLAPNYVTRYDEFPAKYPYYGMTALIETGQAVKLYGLRFGLLETLEKDHSWTLSPTAQSAGAAEDFESNWQGALFSHQLLRDLISHNPVSANAPAYVIHQWDKFLSDSQAISFRGESDNIYEILYTDAKNFWGTESGQDVYIGPRWVRWSEIKDQSIAHCRLCDGEQPKPGIPTYQSKY